MKYPKFVLVDNNLYIGKVELHKALLQEGEKCKGGGWFHYKPEDNSFTFFGESHDFGRASKEDIQNAITFGQVGERNRAHRIAGCKFYWCYDISLLSEREELTDKPATL